jgi:acyl-homoserine lactone acylase PvdQ
MLFLMLKVKLIFKRGVALISAPGLNVMYGDAKGNVAWWATGKLQNTMKGRHEFHLGWFLWKR